MLTFEFIPYHSFQGIDSDQKVRKIIAYTKQKKIIIIEGKLDSFDEANLISKTMEEINKEFKGVEMATMDYDPRKLGFIERLRLNVAGLLLGSRKGFTVIGPASVVKEIKKNPGKIQLFTGGSNNNYKRKKS